MVTNEDLAHSIQRGDRDALATLIERHYDALVGYLYRMTAGDRNLAQDLAQEAFLRLIRGIGRYQYPRPFKPWLYAIATNLTRDHYKRAAVRWKAVEQDSDGLGDVEDGGEPPEAQLEAALEVRQIIAALGRLPEPQREAMVLRYYQEFSLAEISQTLGIPVGTVKSRLSLGLRRLRDLMLERDGMR